MGFVKNFTVDAENHPRGCNFPEVFPEQYMGEAKERNKVLRTPINCTRSTFVLDGEEQTSADIVDEFADDHEVWAQAFIEGWQVKKSICFRTYDCFSKIKKAMLMHCRRSRRMVTMRGISMTAPNHLGSATLYFLKVKHCGMKYHLKLQPSFSSDQELRLSFLFSSRRTPASISPTISPKTKRPGVLKCSAVKVKMKSKRLANNLEKYFAKQHHVGSVRTRQVPFLWKRVGEPI